MEGATREAISNNPHNNQNKRNNRNNNQNSTETRAELRMTGTLRFSHLREFQEERSKWEQAYVKRSKWDRSHAAPAVMREGVSRDR